jgi:hypothetical protein
MVGSSGLAGFCAFVAIAASPLAAVAGAAVDIGLTDGGFEAQGAASGVTDFTYAPAAGAWDFADLEPGVAGDGLINATDNPGSFDQGAATGADGDYFAFVQDNGEFSQTFTATSSASSVQLDWLQSARPGFPTPLAYTVSITGGPGSEGAGAGKITILGTFTPSSATFTSEHSAAFKVVAGAQYTISFSGIDPSDVDETTFIDGVSVSAVPEPTGWALMLLGLGGVGATARAARRARATLAIV